MKHIEKTMIDTYEIGIIKHGIKYMAPKQIFDTVILNLNDLDEKFFNTKIAFKIKYYNSKGVKKKIFTEELEVNIPSLEQILILNAFENPLIIELREVLRKALN